MIKCPTHLRESYRSGRVIPFVGAGASMAVKWKVRGDIKRGPSWRELVDEAARQLGFDDPDLLRFRGTDLQILEYFKIRHSDQTALLTNWFARLMEPPDQAIRQSVLHSAIVGLERSTLFYTTNFDDFLERAFRLNQRRYRVVAVEAEMSGKREEAEIIKFHGDLNHPSQIVLTESDYERRLSLSTPIDFKLRSDLFGRVVLFIGYSFRDPNVSYLFRLFSSAVENAPGRLRGTRGFITVPDPSDFEIKLFRERNLEVIPISRTTPDADVASLLADMAK